VTAEAPNASHERRPRRHRQGGAEVRADRPEGDRKRVEERRGDRGGRPERDGRRGERAQHGDRPDRDPELRAKYVKGRGEGRDRHDKAPDPNSPFAKLAALKEQLEANAKERR
jgi:ATP-dependent RNA helicase SUPV3L1/SUV3